MKPEYANLDSAYEYKTSHGKNLQQTRRIHDSGREGQDDLENKKQIDYMLATSFNPAMDRQQYIESMSDLGSFQRRASDAYGTQVDNEGALFNGKTGNKIVRAKASNAKSVDIRPFLPHPNRTFNRTSVVHPDLHSQITTGRYTTIKKSSGTLAGLSTDRDFLIQSPVKNSMDYHNKTLGDITRGGASTRTFVKNVDYMRYLNEKTNKQ